MPPHPDEIRRRLLAAGALQHEQSAPRSPLRKQKSYEPVTALPSSQQAPKLRSRSVAHPTVKSEPGLNTFGQAINAFARSNDVQHTTSSNNAREGTAFNGTFDNPSNVRGTNAEGNVSYPEFSEEAQQALVVCTPNHPARLHRRTARLSLKLWMKIALGGLLVALPFKLWDASPSFSWQSKKPVLSDEWRLERLNGYFGAAASIDMPSLDGDTASAVRAANNSIELAAAAEYHAASYMYSSLSEPLRKASPHRRQPPEALTSLAHEIEELSRRASVAVESFHVAQSYMRDARDATRVRQDAQASLKAAYEADARNPRKATAELGAADEVLQGFETRISALGNHDKSIGALLDVVGKQAQLWGKFLDALQQMRGDVSVWQEANRLATVPEYNKVVGRFCGITPSVLGAVEVRICRE